MPRRFLFLLVALAFATVTISAAMPQAKPPASPPAEATVTIAGKVITIKYAAPSVKGRQVFGEGGVISKDKSYPVWRTGANSATSLVIDGDLQIKGLAVPKGSYTLYTQINEEPWQLIVNKQTGQWGTIYSKDQDLGRVSMDMGKPPAPIETFKITLTATGPNSGKLELAWDTKVASVPFTVK
jgi:hypothetical protein